MVVFGKVLKEKILIREICMNLCLKVKGKRVFERLLVRVEFLMYICVKVSSIL